MFSSLASFIFGSTFSTTTSGEANQSNQAGNENCQTQLESTENASETQRNLVNCEFEREHTINLTSSTPSVTGAGHRCNNNTNTQTNSNNHKKSAERQGKRNKNNKRNKSNKGGGSGDKQQEASASSLSITKLLNPSESIDDELDENDWFIVSKEDEEEESLPCTDSEDEISVVEIKAKPLPAPAQAGEQGNRGQRRRRQFNGTNSVSYNANQTPIAYSTLNASPSLYSGPRPQQYRNFLHRNRHGNVRASGVNANSGSGVGIGIGIGIGIGETSLSPSRCAAIEAISNGVQVQAEGGVTQSLCVIGTASANNDERSDNDASSNENGTNAIMEESWFVTPPPCFTSMGPINMVTSPFENLLIEHPSMSVYHSIKTAQEATESFVNVDLGGQEPQTLPPRKQPALDVQRNTKKSQVVVQHHQRQQQQQQPPPPQPPQPSGAIVDRYSLVQVKQDVLARNNQKKCDVRKRQNLCRGAIKRANKVRDCQSKGHRPRRADLQHYKVVSGANNNRKCCF